MAKYVCDYSTLEGKIEEMISNDDMLNTLTHSSVLENLTSDSRWASASKNEFDAAMLTKANKLIKHLSELRKFIDYIEKSEQAIKEADHELASSFKL